MVRKSLLKSDINILKKLSDKFKFNLNFEGGESETFVINCPLFSNPIKINQGKKYGMVIEEGLK